MPHQRWQQLTASLHLSQLIKSPTRVQAKSSTLIDHIYASQEHHVIKSGVLEVGLSDHSLIYMVRKTGQTKHGNLPSRHQIRYYKWNPQNLEDLTTELAMTSWNDIYLAPTVDDMLSKFLTKLKSILHRHVKIKKRFVKSSSLPPWLDKEVLDSMRLRDHLKSTKKRDNYKKNSKMLLPILSSEKRKNT